MIKKANFFMMAVVALGVFGSATDGGIWVDPNSFTVEIVEGCALTVPLTIGNDGMADIYFTLRSREISRKVLGALSESADERSAVAAIETTEEKIILEYQFSEPIVTTRDGYDFIRMEGVELYQQTGAPIVPVRPVTLLVPFGKKVVGTKITVVDTHGLPDIYQLPPAQEPYPLDSQVAPKETLPDSSIYGQATPWPGIIHEEVAVQSKRGYHLLIVNLFPLQYTPAAGTITYAARLRLELDLADSADFDVFQPSADTKSALMENLDNPAALQTYPVEGMSLPKLAGESALPGGGPYQYVIITSESLKNAPAPWNFPALRDAKIAQGITATIVTTEWIYSNYSGSRPDGGSDNQTRIRNFLIDAYQTWGTEYVLLGGTNAIVPARMFRVDGENMPVDMYYGCVDPQACTFDGDADGIYGETTDGVGGGDVDLFAEIYVGRAAVDNASELANFINKTLTYASTQNEYLPRISMLGERLGFGGVAEYAKPAMEQIRLGGQYDGYFTYGFENHTQPDFYDFDTSVNLYDADGTWPKSNLIDLMNEGVQVFNHLGHANYTYDMKLYTSDLASLTNSDYFFAYSQGCNPGGFDNANCFAEVITSMAYGAFAVVMNARSGWGRYNSTDGPSQRFARQFWDAALNEDMLELGRANQDSKEDNLWDINGSRIRWCYYELNLFGDPQQQLRFEEACEWFTLEPREGTIEPNSAVDIKVSFEVMELATGTYEAQIMIISNDPCSPAIVPVKMTLKPDNLRVVPAGGFESAGTEGGPFSPACMVYTLTNINLAESVNWTTLAAEDWLSVSPPAGVLEPNESIDVSVCIDPNADSLDPNLYNQTLIFQNSDSNSIKTRWVSLTVKPPDCFTEFFTDSGNDLEGCTVKFSPDGSVAYYEACRDKADGFPTDPTGGTFVALWDDDFAEVVLGPEEQICFYGDCCDRFYIGSNGYLTFAAGDTEYNPSLVNHFLVPRISGTFIDLDPPNDHCISYKKLPDRIAVTFDHVLLFGDKTGAANSFQIEYFYADQSFRITWLQVAKKNTIAGLSRGRGLPPVFFAESNLSKYSPCWFCSDFDRDYQVDLTDLAVLVAHWLDEGCYSPFWCGRTDMDFNGVTDLDDFDILMQQWLSEHWWLNPIGYWKFDEGEGNIAYDSAYDHHGSLQGGPLWVAGKIGEYALDFDGMNDYVDLGDIFNDVQLPVTMSAWVFKRNDNGHRIFQSDNTSDTKSGFWFWITTAGEIQGAYGANTGLYGDSRRSKLSGPIVENNVWTFVAAVIRGPEDMNLYINGVDAGGEYEGTGGDMAHVVGAKASIGWSIWGPAYYDGKIDDLMIFNRALSAQEIQALFAEGIAGKALSPYPASGQKRVDPDVILTWQAGKDALSHDVYFGADCNAVADATPDSDEFMGNQDPNSWNPGGLEQGTTYYWRIDEHDGLNVYKGDIWSFTTLFDVNLIGWWKLDEGQGNTTYDSSYDNNGTLQGGPLWVSGMIGEYALDFDGTDDYVELGDIFNDVQLPVTMSAWILRRGNNTYPIFFSDDISEESKCVGFWLKITPENQLHASYGSYTGDWSASRRSKLSSTYIENDIWTYVAAVIRGPEDMDLYINGVDAGGEYSGTGGDLAHLEGANARIGLDSRFSYYCSGMIDDLMIFDRSLSALEIQALYQRGLSRRALSPYPADGQNRLDPNVILSWQPGKDALSHDVYFGADCNAVTDATPDCDEFMGNQDANYWDPNDLEPGITYYWRIDEHDGSKVHKGEVWSFTTLLDANLIGWWKMDEGQGDTAYDSAYDFHGTLQGGPLWVAGKVGEYALDFDGSNDYVDLDDIFNDVELPVTMSAWIFKRGDSGHRIFQSDNTSDTKSGFWFWVYLDGTLQAAYGANTGLYGDSRRSKVSDTIVTNDVWTHVAAVIRGPEDMDIYINGVDAGGEYEGTGGDMVHVTGANASIGWSIWGPAYFDGKMDDLMIFDRSLSALEIQALYERGLAILGR